MFSETIMAVVSWYMQHITYLWIIILMAVESSFIPFPSEVVIPPAAWKAAQGNMSLALVIVCGVIGSLIGALFNYYLGLYLGRKAIYALAEKRFAHALFIDRRSVKKAEDFFLRYGAVSTFVGRLVPGVRQLISIPAGLSAMKLSSFLLYTTMGSVLWNSCLAFLGFYLYSQKELLETLYNRMSMILMILGGAFVIFMVIRHLRRQRALSKNVLLDDSQDESTSGE